MPLRGLGSLGASDVLVGQCPCLLWDFRPPSDMTKRFALVRRFGLCVWV